MNTDHLVGSINFLLAMKVVENNEAEVQLHNFARPQEIVTGLQASTVTEGNRTDTQFDLVRRKNVEEVGIREESSRKKEKKNILSNHKSNNINRNRSRMVGRAYQEFTACHMAHDGAASISADVEDVMKCIVSSIMQSKAVFRQAKVFTCSVQLKCKLQNVVF